MWRWLAPLVIVIALAAGGIYWQTQKGVPVDATTVRVQRIDVFVDEQAKTRVPVVYRITMPFQGRIVPIELVEGSPVYQGQVVARIVQEDLETAVTEATARVRRLEEKIVENDDTRLEKTALEEMKNVLESMDRAVESASEETVASKARFDFAEKEFNRARDLFSKRAASEVDVNRAEVDQIEDRVNYQKDILTLRAMEAMRAGMQLFPRAINETIEKKVLARAVLEREKAEAQAQLDMRLRERERGQMTSPVDGVVLHRDVFNEQLLPAGALLLEIGRLEDLEVEADVLSQDAVAVEVGQRVDIHGPAIGPRPVRGNVARIYPQGFTKVSSLGVEQQRVKVVIAFDSEPDDGPSSIQERRLGADYRVQVRIYTASKESAVVAPRSALFRDRTGDWRIFVVRDGRARLAKVTLGLQNDELVEILSGVRADDVVILAPESDLADGQRVEPMLLDAQNGAEPDRS